MKHKELLSLPAPVDQTGSTTNRCYYIVAAIHNLKDKQLLEVCTYNKDSTIKRRTFITPDNEWFNYWVETNKWDKIRTIYNDYWINSIHHIYISDIELPDKSNSIICKFFKISKRIKKEYGGSIKMRPQGLIYINNFQKRATDALAESKAKAKERELCKIISNTNLEIPDNFLEFIIESVLPNDALAFYKTSYNQARVICALCGHKYTFNDKPYNQGITHCPYCSKQVAFATINSASRAHRYSGHAAYLDKAGDNFVIRCFHIKRDMSARYRDLKDRLVEFARYYYKKGKTRMLLKESWCSFYNQKEQLERFYLQKSVSVWRECQFMKRSIENLKGTFFENNIELFNLMIKRSHTAIMMIHKFNTWTALESLSKIGYYGIVEEFATGRNKQDTVINLYGKKANAIIGVPHSILLKYKYSKLRERDILAIKQLISYGRLGQLTQERLDFISSILTNSSIDPLAIFRTFGLEKILNYINKQARLKTQKDREYYGDISVECSPQAAWRDFHDYRKDLIDLGQDISDEGIMFPRDLYAAHQAATMRVVEKRDRLKSMAQKEKYDLYSKSVKKYVRKSMQGDVYCIKVLATPNELSADAKALRHCAGSDRYVEAVAAKRAIMFCVRHTSAPNKPLYTLEVQACGLVIVQLRGYGNTEAPKAVYDFVDSYLNTIEPSRT